jgi:hypothetical protein
MSKPGISYAIQSERGAALIVALIILVALGMIAAISIEVSDTEMNIAGNYLNRSRALLAAEAGQARTEAVMNLNPDMTASDSLMAFINADTLLPNSHFKVAMDTGMPLRKVIAVGYSVQGGAAGIEVTYRHRLNPINIWNNAVFAGHGQNSMSIRGNVGIHGSVHILGDGEPFVDANSNGIRDAGEPYTDANHDGVYDAPMTADSVGLSMNGTASLTNNYDGMSATLSSRLPALPTTQYAGETVQTLDAELRLKHGTVELDGTGTIGDPNVVGGAPAVKETFDGAYASDGYTGSQGENGVHADNGSGNGYDLPDGKVKMPNLDEPYTDKFGTSHISYMTYLKSNALVISGNLVLEQGIAQALISGGSGSIFMDAAGNLAVTGMVYVEGDIVIKGANPIEYDGRFTLISEGNVTMDADFLSKGIFPSDDAAGIIAHGRMDLGVNKSQLQLMGAFFAQEEIITTKQTELAGTLVSNYFGATQVPDIYQVPDLVKHMPPGMPGADDVYLYAWMRVPKSWVELD